MKPPISINHVSDTGNTALHAAVNSGNALLVSLLLKRGDINVNCLNTQCENASPLHLAVLHGNFINISCLYIFFDQGNVTNAES